MATTTNLGITLPTVGGDNDTWGTVNNTAINAFDAIFASNGTSISLNVGSGKTLAMAGTLALSGTGTVTGTLNAVGATAVNVADSTFFLKDNSDNTKIAQFQCSGITTGTTRTFTLPDANTTVVGTDATQTLTNKTLTAPVISTISNTGTVTLPTATTTLVGRDTTDTLTNKTLTTPVFSGTPTGTVTSGTYTPTISNTANVASSSIFDLQYLRVGNVVTVSGRIGITPSGAGGTVFRLSLPVSTNMTAQGQLAGTGMSDSGGEVGWFEADHVDDLARFQYSAVSAALDYIYFSFTYQVL